MSSLAANKVLVNRFCMRYRCASREEANSNMDTNSIILKVESSAK